MAEADLTQLAQHLAAAPELPVLDPPLYGLPALHLAQHSLQTSELAAWAIGVSQLTWEHYKPSWLMMALIVTEWARCYGPARNDQ